MRHSGSQQFLILVLILDFLKLNDHTNVSDDYHNGRLEVVINHQTSDLGVYPVFIFGIATLLGLFLLENDLEESLLILSPFGVLDHFLETDKIWVENTFLGRGWTPCRPDSSILVHVLPEDLLHQAVLFARQYRFRWVSAVLHILYNIQDLPQFLIHETHLLLLGRLNDKDSLWHFLQ